MSSSAAALRQDPFPASRASRTGTAVPQSRILEEAHHHNTAFPFSFPLVADAHTGGELSDDSAGSNASDSDRDRHRQSPAARGRPRRVNPAWTAATRNQKPPKVNNTSDMLEVQPAGVGLKAGRAVSPARPRSGKQPRIPVSPRKISLEATAEAVAAASEFMDIFIHRDSYHHDFGFDITGGSDTGHALVVSGVLLGGPADMAGLCPEDIVLALDNIPAAELSHVDTVQMIKTALEIHLKIQRIPSSLLSAGTRPLDKEATDGHIGLRTHRRSGARHGSMADVEAAAGDRAGVDSNQHQIAPSLRPHSSKNKHGGATVRDEQNSDGSVVGELNNQAYAWIDIGQQPCSPPPEEDTLSTHAQATGPGTANMLPERKCVLLVSDDVHLGLLIRGGLEYGLGIYVTGLDKASAAETANLRVGDQILSVNNCDFRRITHTKAVRILRTHRHMTLRVRYVGKLPYARRLTPNSLSSSSSLQNAQDNLQSLFTNAALLTDPAEEEIDRLTREAMLEQTPGTGDEYYDESGIDMPYESYMLDLELDDEVLKLKQKMKAKRELNSVQLDRPRSGRVRSSSNNTDYWTSVVEQNAEMLLKDESEKEALMYFLNEYSTGALGVDALVLSLFHTMDSLPNFQLLDDIRNLISPQDISRYDSLMSGMKTELMTSPGNLSSRSMTDIFSPSLLSLSDSVPFIKPLPAGMPLKSAIKSSSFSKTQQTPPTVVDPVSYGPVDVILPSIPVAQPPLPTTAWPVMVPQTVGAGSVWVQQPVSAQLPLPLQPMAVGPQFFNGQYAQAAMVPAGSVYPGWSDDRARFAEYAAEMGQAMGPPGASVWPHGRKSYSIDCLPQSLMYQDGRSYGPRNHDGGNMRRRPSYADTYNHPKTSAPYDYSDTPAGIARSMSKMSDHPRRSFIDEDHIQVHRGYDSDDRQRNPRNRQTPTPPDRLVDHPRRRNRSMAGSLDGNHSGLLSAPKTRRESRRVSSPGTETPILESYPHEPASGIPVSKSRPHSLQVPVDPSTLAANGESTSPVIIETVSVKKTAPFLGLAIEGGTDTNHPLPRIINIQPKGCAHINGQLKVGHVIISVNGTKLENLTHAECVALITGIFAKKEVTSMQFTVKNTVKPVAT